jgi:hypothetical protein
MDFNLKGTEDFQGRSAAKIVHGLGNDDSNFDSQACLLLVCCCVSHGRVTGGHPDWVVLITR